MFLSSRAQRHSPYTSSNDSRSPISQPRSSPSSRRSSGFSSASSSFVASLPTAYSTYSVSAESPTLKRARNFSEREDHVSSDWECDLAYAVVHASDCTTCRAYKAHVSDAKKLSSNIQRALQDRDKQLDTYFADGVEEGRRAQQVQDQDRIHELEGAKSDATALVARLRAEIRDSSAQQNQLQSQLRLAQTECEALRKRVQELLLAMPTENANSLSKPESGSRFAKPEPELLAQHSLPPRPEVYPPHAPFHHPIRMPKTLRQLQLLMSKAHQPGNEDTLTRIKVLCTEAHNTPRERKTEMQRYILANWRNPEPATAPSSSYGHSQPPLLLGPHHSVQPHVNNPRADDPTEVWHAYLTVHQGSWPRGVRREADGSPHFDDLKASRTVARLRPTGGDSSFRNEWMSCVVGMFATPGMYADLLRREGLVVAPGHMAVRRPYSASNGETIRVEDVVRHFADAGVTVVDAEREIEAWAREYQAAIIYPNDAKSRSKPNNPQHHHKTSTTLPYSRGTRSYDREQEERFGWR
ncbi:hypothetical protein MIND_01066300 [Mycena indigotica]|uniref:Uncharacterized protein n=1 Tax=Mycena indigotica TaxID=2126181 RepID=A0A8H6SBH5_9AGAR|nr:uncharacterized protein MIND_01066300 [Mycena indigotica]KAF7295272.1 hypothetical protein MIND_01066300 [Mycena indigotica]